MVIYKLVRVAKQSELQNCTYQYRRNHISGNKAKGRISKWVFQKNKARQIFRKTNNFYPLIRSKNHRFSENLACFVFLNTRFKIRPFALLPTNACKFRCLVQHIYRITFLNNLKNTDPVKQCILNLFKNIHREKAPSNKSPALTKNTNVGIWIVGTSNQLFIRGS